MYQSRVIPCLLLKGHGLVKTCKFKNPVYVGDPIIAVRIFNEKEVDELVILDIEASLQKREPNFELIAEIAGECFIPLCYGGGIITNLNGSSVAGWKKWQLIMCAIYHDTCRLFIAKNFPIIR